MNAMTEVLETTETPKRRLTVFRNTQTEQYRIEEKRDGGQWSLLLMGSSETEARRQWNNLITTNEFKRN